MSAFGYPRATGLCARAKFLRLPWFNMWRAGDNPQNRRPQTVPALGREANLIVRFFPRVEN